MEVERALSHRLPPLSPEEELLWRLDRKINLRGFGVDLELAARAGALVESEQARISAELSELTDGQVAGPTKLENLKDFVNARGHCMAKANKRAVAQVLAHEPDDLVRQVLEKRQESSNTGVTKFDSLAAATFPDQRVRGLLHYHGAHTGRWTSGGFNLHNLPREGKVDVPKVIAAIQANDLERIRALGGAPLEAIASVARGLVISTLGRVFLIGDFSAIESRVAAWFADEVWKLDAYRRYDATGDPEFESYCIIASRMLGRKVAPEDSEARQYGKVLDLAFIFGGTIGPWRKMRPDDPRSDTEIMAQEVRPFRRLHPGTVQLWRSLERAALRCVRIGEPVHRSRFGFEIDEENTLQMILPSGRRLHYRNARLGPGKYGDEAISYDATGSARPELWYGSLTENLVQSTARDLLVNALFKLEAAGFPVTLHVHDEIVVEVHPALADEKLFKHCMLSLPDWAFDLPIAAKVRVSERYIKSADAALSASSPPNSPEKLEEELDEVPNKQILADEACAVAAVQAENPFTPPPPELHTCAHCHLDPPDGSECPSSYNDAWLHARCVDDFIRAREADLGIAWTKPASPLKPPPAALPTEPPPAVPPPNGKGNGQTAWTSDDEPDEGYTSGEDDSPAKGPPTASYIYCTAHSTPYMKVVRLAGKSFPTYHWVSGGWVKGWPKERPHVPYRLPELAGIAISAVTHPPKNSSLEALNHFIGSQAFVAAPRCAHICAEERIEGELSGRNLFMPAKSNHTPSLPGLAYRIETVSLNWDDELGEAINPPRIRWEGPVEVSANDALAAARPRKEQRGQSAEDFLDDVLGVNGAALVKRIEEQGGKRGFSLRQLRHARKKCGAVAVRRGGLGEQGVWWWVLPEQMTPEERANPQEED